MTNLSSPFVAASDLVRWLTGNTARLVLVLAVVVGLAILALGSMIFSGSETSEGAAWREYIQAREEVSSGRQDVDWLEALILFGPQSDFDGNYLRASTTPRLWALQFAADMELAEGSRLAYTNREEAAERLHHAIEFYNHIEEAGVEGMLAERTLLGKAHAHEILLGCTADLREFRRNYEAAISCLDRLTGTATNTAIKDTARRRKEVLVNFGKDSWTEGSLSKGDFYSWLGKYVPPEAPDNPFPSSPSPFNFPPQPTIPFPDEGELLPPPVLDRPTDFPIEPAGSSETEDPASGDDPADNPADDPADNPADDPADNSADDPADDPAGNPADDPADDPQEG